MVVCTVALALLGAPADAQDKLRVRTDGATIAYRDLGQGTPLLLLHGFGETGRTWDPLVGELGRRYRLIIPDLRGHGDSSNPLPYFTHRDAAADVFGLLDQLGVDQTNAVGFSSGAMTLLHMATSQPNRLSAMALVGAAPYLPEQARQILRSMNPDAIPMADLDAMGLVHGDTAQARLLLRQFVDFKDSYTDVSFTPPLLATITARTLVIHGDRDPFFPVEVAVEVFSSVSNSYLLVIPNLDHQPFPEDEAGRRYYTESLLRFFDATWN